MQRSSTKIGALATALAKAQSELANPEKSLIATLPSPIAGGVGQSFRYASLASGLELVRKCLGQQEIATVQATAIDRDTGLIRLTTTLVHASGEWMASDWPVCSVAETASPHRMGAALTYARRYALFTLVGIAGEDDLDAPDLPTAGAADTRSRLHERGHGLGGLPQPAAPAATSSGPLRLSQGRAPAGRQKPALLPPEPSAALRDQLLAELLELDEASALSAWAYKALPRKNQLINTDALAVEAAFEARLNDLGEAAQSPTSESQNGEQVRSEPRKPLRIKPASEEVTVLKKPVRERDRGHLKFVAGQPCLVCGRTPSDPHHIRFADSWTVGRKVSDRFTVPLCRIHHHELHRRGNERVWWQQQGIDPLLRADGLWKMTHTLAADGSFLDDNPARPEVNGKLFSAGPNPSESGHDETKPIAGPDAR